MKDGQRRRAIHKGGRRGIQVSGHSEPQGRKGAVEEDPPSLPAKTLES
jgi:hypothetical protein